MATKTLMTKKLVIPEIDITKDTAARDMYEVSGQVV